MWEGGSHTGHVQGPLHDIHDIMYIQVYNTYNILYIASPLRGLYIHHAANGFDPKGAGCLGRPVRLFLPEN